MHRGIVYLLLPAISKNGGWSMTEKILCLTIYCELNYDLKMKIIKNL